MSSKKNKTGAKNPTRKQQAERIKQAEERERRAKEAAEAKARTKKIFTVVVCALLGPASCSPRRALTVLSL